MLFLIYNVDISGRKEQVTLGLLRYKWIKEGGNQQKVILGKWMAAESSVIIFDEPTKGIDVGSKSEIYVLMRRLASQGKGVIMVSSEMPELLSVCDTICVFRDGGIRMTYAVREATEEKILKSSTGEE